MAIDSTIARPKSERSQRPFQLSGFTLIEILVVLFIMAIAMRSVIPALPSWERAQTPETQWMNAFKAAQTEARAKDIWIELVPTPQPEWLSWQWVTASGRWETSAWSQPMPLTGDALRIEAVTPFPKQHIWIAPQKVIPFAQAVCLPARQCVILSPSGDIMLGSAGDIKHSLN